MIRVDAVWLAVQPLDMRLGTEAAPARVMHKELLARGVRVGKGKRGLNTALRDRLAVSSI